METLQNVLVAEVEGLQPLAHLEARILEVIEQLRTTRREKAVLEQEVAALRERLGESEQRGRDLSKELEARRLERRQISERLEKLLAQIDLLAQ